MMPVPIFRGDQPATEYSFQSTTPEPSTPRQDSLDAEVNGELLNIPIVPPVHYVQMLEQELDGARKKIQEYETTSTYPAYRPHIVIDSFPSASCSSSQLALPNFPRRKSQPERATGIHQFQFQLAVSTSVRIKVRTRLPSQLYLTSIPIAVQTTYSRLSLGSEVIKRQRDYADREPASKKARRNSRPTSTSSQSNSVTDSPSPHSTSTDFDDPTASHSNEADWSAEYNPEVDKALEVNLMQKITNKQGANHIKFSPDGQLLAVLASESEAVAIYNVATGAEICLLEDLYVKERSSFTHDLDFSFDGKYLATCTGWPENIIRIWEVGKRRVRNAFKGHLDDILCLDFSPDGRLLISGSQDGTARIWGMRDGSSRIIDRSDFGISSVRFSPDGRHVAAGTCNYDVLLWETRSGRLVASWKGHTRTVSTIFFMPNGEGLMSGSWDGTLKYRDISGSTARTSDRKGATDDAERKESLTFVRHTRAKISVSISPDGQWLAFDSVDCAVRIWNTCTGEEQCILRAHDQEVSSVHFCPTGGYLASADCGGQVRIWSHKRQVVMPCKSEGMEQIS